MALFPTGTAADIGDAVPADYWQKLGVLLNTAVFYDVKNPDFGAVGNGTTDDTAAIQACIDAVSTAGGGTVFFPPGVYRVTAPIVPKSYVHLLGTEVASRYWGYSTSSPLSSSAIKVGSGFTGTGLLKPGTTFTAASISNLALLGDNIGAIHGIEFPSTTSTEQNFRLRGVAIIGMGGDAIRGRLYAARFSDFFIGGCHGWGLNAVNQWSDVRFFNGYIAGNISGALNLDGTGQAGYVRFQMVRFERSGWDSANISTPTNTSAPGIRLRYANDFAFLNCETDANSGHGLDIEVATSAGRLYNGVFVGCWFKRDGFGTMAALGEFAAVKVLGNGVTASQVKFDNCFTVAAKADDGGGNPAYLHPKYGLWWENTADIAWLGGRVDGGHSGGKFYSGASAWDAVNTRPQLALLEDKLLNIHRATTRPTAGISGTNGAATIMVDSSLTPPKLIFRDGSSWRDAAGNVV